MVTRKLTDYCLGLYATPAYLDAHAPIREREDLAGHPIVGYVDDLLFSRELMFHRGLCRNPLIHLRCTSVVGQQQAALADGGIAVLPYYLTYDDARLRRYCRNCASSVLTGSAAAATSAARCATAWCGTTWWSCASACNGCCCNSQLSKTDQSMRDKLTS